MYRQGDLIIIEVDSAVVHEAEKRGKRVPRENNQLILAHGESTGHAHAIREHAVEMFDQGNNRYLSAVTPFTLVHEEHAPITIPAGTFKVIRQREYSPIDYSRPITD